MEEVERNFHREMQNIYKLALSNCKYRATYFLQMVNDNGGLEAAQILLAKPGIQYGFEELWKCGRLDLTVESLVLRNPWRQLFTPHELETARKRLESLNYSFGNGEVI